MTIMTKRTIKPLTSEQLFNRLGWQYVREVEKKDCKFVKTDNLRNQLANMVRLITNNQRWGLYIRGFVGNGKTTAVNALKNTINILIDEHYFKQSEIFDWDWMRVVNAREMVNMYIRNNDEMQFKAVKESRWLVVDDIGTDPAEIMLYGTKFYPFVELMDYRYERRLPTVIVSNLKESELKAKYNDERFSDRFNEMFNATTFRDNSFRV